MEIFSDIQIAEVISMIFFVILGLGCMMGSWWLIEKMTPFSIEDELKDKNLAIAVLMGAIFIALSILIAAVIVS